MIIIIIIIMLFRLSYALSWSDTQELHGLLQYLRVKSCRNDLNIASSTLRFHHSIHPSNASSSIYITEYLLKLGTVLNATDMN